MDRSVVSAPLGTEFDAFLFAPVEVELSGTTLTVVSALARLNIDPWSEAAELARMPRERASQRLAAMIGKLSGLPAAGGQTQKIADGLISLLPRGAAAPLRVGAQALPSLPERAMAILVALLIVAAALGVLGVVNRGSLESLAKIGTSASSNAQSPN